jgi:hypothetical protein
VIRLIRTTGSAIAICAATFSSVKAQAPASSVSLGFGVDTTISDVGNIVRLVRAYLSKPDSSARSRGLWSTSSSFDRRLGDVSAGDVYQGFRATVLGIVPSGPGDSVYVVKILHATADSGGRHISPLALQRLYAVRESGAPFSFRLSAALPRLTKNWERRSKGRMTFWYAPGQRPNVRKIQSAVRFVDSVATLFKVPAPAHMDVYITETIDEAQRAIGLDFIVEASGPGGGRGGRSLPSGIVLVGDPSIGEAYFHEFVHAILSPTIRPGNGILGEGIPTWLGGSQGRTPREMYAFLKHEQDADPTLTLAGVLNYDFAERPAKLGSDLQRATGALIANAVFRKNGITALRQFAQLRGDTDALLRELATQLGMPNADSKSLDEWWRNEVERVSGSMRK